MQLIENEDIYIKKNFKFLDHYIYKTSSITYELGILVLIIEGRFKKYKVIEISKPDNKGTTIYLERLIEDDIEKYDLEIQRRIKNFDNKYSTNIMSIFQSMKSNTKQK